DCGRDRVLRGRREVRDARAAAEPVLVASCTEDAAIRQWQQALGREESAGGLIREPATVPANQAPVFRGDPQRSVAIHAEPLEAVRRESLSEPERLEAHAVE